MKKVIHYHTSEALLGSIDSGIVKSLCGLRKSLRAHVSAVSVDDFTSNKNACKLCLRLIGSRYGVKPVDDSAAKGAVARNCFTCRHEKLASYAHPCDQCREFEHWEDKNAPVPKPKKHCATCEYRGDDPSATCEECDDEFSEWTPLTTSRATDDIPPTKILLTLVYRDELMIIRYFESKEDLSEYLSELDVAAANMMVFEGKLNNLDVKKRWDIAC